MAGVKDFLLKFQPGVVTTLPLCSPTALQLSAQAQEGALTDLQLTEVFSSDPVLAARLCGAANSIFFNLTNRDVWATEECLARVGYKYATELVVVSAEATNKWREINLLRELWHHSNQVSEIAKALCLSASNSDIDINAVKLSALIHDIGYLVMGAFENSSSKTLKMLKAEHAPTLITHQHQELGAALAVAWTLPPMLCQIIRNHHNPDKIADAVGRKIGLIVSIAEDIVSNERSLSDEDQAHIREIGINVEMVKEMFHERKNLG